MRSSASSSIIAAAEASRVTGLRPFPAEWGTLIGDSSTRFGAPFGHLRHRAVLPQIVCRRDGPTAREQAFGRLAQNDRVRDPAFLGTLSVRR